MLDKVSHSTVDLSDVKVLVCKEKNENEQEIRSMEHGYLSHCFKSRTRDLGHTPFRVIPRPLCSTCHGLPSKEKTKSFIRLKVLESKVPKFEK